MDLKTIFTVLRFALSAKLNQVFSHYTSISTLIKIFKYTTRKILVKKLIFPFVNQFGNLQSRINGHLNLITRSLLCNIYPTGFHNTLTVVIHNMWCDVIHKMWYIIYFICDKIPFTTGAHDLRYIGLSKIDCFLYKILTWMGNNYFTKWVGIKLSL